MIVAAFAPGFMRIKVAGEINIRPVFRGAPVRVDLYDHGALRCWWGVPEDRPVV